MLALKAKQGVTRIGEPHVTHPLKVSNGGFATSDQAGRDFNPDTLRIFAVEPSQALRIDVGDDAGAGCNELIAHSAPYSLRSASVHRAVRSCDGAVRKLSERSPAVNHHSNIGQRILTTLPPGASLLSLALLG